jgi:XTP/dITP diphosphohydrolase
MKYVLASGNKHKLDEINEIMNEFNIELIMMDEIGLGDLEIVEDGNTFEENSFIKAKTVRDITNLPTIADDSGLMVDYLNGEPGIYSARYSGENASYETNNVKLLTELNGVGKIDRSARFITVITLLFPNGDKIVARGIVEGEISEKMRGENGFGYDSLFIVKGHDITFAEMDSNLKNRISHRAKALQELRVQLENYYGESNENINN